MFNEHPVADRFSRAKQAGFAAVEYLHPYANPATTVKQWLDDADVEMILLNTLVGNSEKGDCGLAAVPGRESEFREHIEQALEYATTCGASMIHVMAGVVTEGTSRKAAEVKCIENLTMAASLAKESGIRLLLEPLNTKDVPGYLHTTCSQTKQIIKAVKRDNVLLQYDFYHRQIMEGNLAELLKEHLDIVGHIQFSSLPGRHEPQHGEVNMAYLFDVIDELGYIGWVGCEYTPKGETIEGLTWGQAFGLGI